jgi:hypothetical protein
VQVSLMAKHYFSYKTTSKINLEMDDKFRAPEIAFCVNYTHILKTYKNLIYVPKTDDFLMKRQLNDTLEHLTVREVFDRTPANTSILKECERRAHHEDLVGNTVTEDGPKCYDTFKVNKVMIQRKVCYIISPHGEAGRQKYRTSDLIQALITPGKYYQVILTDAFSDTSWVQVIAYYGEYPYHSRHFAIGHERFREGGLPIDNHYKLSFKYYEITLLPSPYDTNCTYNPRTFEAKCKTDCLTRGLKTVNRVPSTEYVTEPVDMIPVTPDDTDFQINSVRARYITALHTQCNDKCRQRRCHFDFTITNSKSRVTTGRNIVLMPVTTHAPTVYVSAIESITLAEFVLYIFSMFGIWFGISVWSFNPIRTVDRFHKTKDKMRGYKRRDIELATISTSTKTDIPTPAWKVCSSKVNSQPDVKIQPVKCNHTLKAFPIDQDPKNVSRKQDKDNAQGHSLAIP